MEVMAWNVEFTNEFERWWIELDEAIQDAIDRAVHLLEACGPRYGFRRAATSEPQGTETCGS